MRLPNEVLYLDKEMREALLIARTYPRVDTYCKTVGVSRNVVQYQLQKVRKYYGVATNHQAIHQAWLRTHVTISYGYEERLMNRPKLTPHTVRALHVVAGTDTYDAAAAKLECSLLYLRNMVRDLKHEFGWSLGNRATLVNAMWDYGYFKKPKA